MNLKQVEELLKLMKAYGADSVKLEDKDSSIHIKMTSVQKPGPLRQAADPAQNDLVASNEAVDLKIDENDNSSETAVACPTVGVFYSAPGPDEAPFVGVGDHVEKDTILCIIEAMKVMNEVPAGIAGTITEILPVNGDRVEYEQTLFMIRADS